MARQQSSSNPAGTQPAAGGFTDRQFRGLARLGDLVANLDEALAGPLGGVVVEKVTEGTALYGRYDLPALAENLLAAVQALQDSGALAFVRDNADLINGLLTQLPALTEALSGQLKDRSPAELQRQWTELMSVVQSVNAVSDFVREHLTPSTIETVVRAGQFLQDHQTDEALLDLLRTVGHLHRNGTLNALCELSDYVSASVTPLDRGALVENLLQELQDSSLARMLRLAESFDQAVAESRRDDGHYGGVSGLFHLLREPQVQEGLRMLATLPNRLEGSAKGTGNNGAGHG